MSASQSQPSAAWEDYWDIDCILAEAQKIPVVFNIDAEGLGYLEGDTEEHIPRGTRLELPLWMVEALASNEFVELELPKAYGTTIRRSLTASATNIDLHRLNPYYYAFGIKLVDLIVDDNLNRILAKSFKSRLELILHYTQAAGKGDMLEFLQTLDETEIELYKIGQESSRSNARWTNRALGKLHTADVHQRGGTRRKT